MSKIAIMRQMLLEGKHTKEELQAGSGVALSTVSVQLGYHLKDKYNILKEVVDGKKVYSMKEKTDADFGEEEGAEEVVDTDDSEQDPKLEPTDAELKEVKAQGLDKMPADAELEALLDQ